VLRSTDAVDQWTDRHLRLEIVVHAVDPLVYALTVYAESELITVPETQLWFYSVADFSSSGPLLSVKFHHDRLKGVGLRTQKLKIWNFIYIHIYIFIG